jgi:hypothetical protein
MPSLRTHGRIGGDEHRTVALPVR